jgi:hypothetical protein
MVTSTQDSQKGCSPALVAATWRSGSRWIARGFAASYPEEEFWARHELHFAKEVPDGYGVLTGYMVPALMREIAEARGFGPLVHVVRDPVATAISGFRKFGYYGRGGPGIEGKLQYWYATNRLIQNLGQQWQNRVWTVKVEDLWRADGLVRLAEFFGLEPNDKLREMQGVVDNASDSSVEIPPFIVREHIKRLAVNFGYDLYNT